MHEIPDEVDVESLIEASDGEGAETAPHASKRAALANALSGLKRRFYGRGPDRVKAYLNDEYVFVVLEGGLTPSEETLLSAGRASLVRDYRLAFQESVRPTIVKAVEEILGSEVLDYHSQIVFDPPRTFEVFVLGEGAPPGGARTATEDGRPAG